MPLVHTVGFLQIAWLSAHVTVSSACYHLMSTTSWTATVMYLTGPVAVLAVLLYAVVPSRAGASTPALRPSHVLSRPGLLETAFALAVVRGVASVLEHWFNYPYAEALLGDTPTLSPSVWLALGAYLATFAAPFTLPILRNNVFVSTAVHACLAAVCVLLAFSEDRGINEHMLAGVGFGIGACDVLLLAAAVALHRTTQASVSDPHTAQHVTYVVGVSKLASALGPALHHELLWYPDDAFAMWLLVVLVAMVVVLVAGRSAGRVSDAYLTW